MPRPSVPVSRRSTSTIWTWNPFRDWQKLIFYYYVDHYVNFKDLVNDLYKVCLRMSTVNPAFFSTNAINHWWMSDLAPLSHALCLV